MSPDSSDPNVSVQEPTFLLSGQDLTADFLVELWVHLNLFLGHTKQDIHLDDVLGEVLEAVDSVLADYGTRVSPLIDAPDLPVPLRDALRLAEQMRQWTPRYPLLPLTDRVDPLSPSHSK